LSKIEKILAVIGIVGMILILLFWPTEEKKEKKPIEVKIRTEKNVGFEDKTPTYLKPDEQNDQTVKSFLTELMGNDYQLLLLLFNPEKLDKNTDQMTEEEFADYAKEVGSKIKEGKTMVKGQITKIKRSKEHNIYTVVLTFQDGTQKQFNLSVKDGQIQTPINQLK